MKKITTPLMIITATCLLAACSKESAFVFDTRLGPVTAQQIETLPDTLSGDSKNARRASYTLEGKGMKDPKGGNE